MRAAFALLTALALLGGCTQDEHGGFGEAPPQTEAPSPATTQTGSPEPARRVRVSAPGGLRFAPETLQIQAGETTEIELVNQDTQDHTFVVSELAVAMLAGAGQTVRTTVTVDGRNRGSFSYFCSIAGHRAGGMEGTITVG